MLWHVLLLLLPPVSVLVGHLMKDDRDRRILALRQQVLIPQRQLGNHPRLLRAERLALLLTRARMTRQQLRDSLVIVKPATRS